MNHRRVISVASLISGLVAFYLHLGKTGVVPMPPCSVGPKGCEYIQNSAYGWFPIHPFMGMPRGFDIALIGTVGYAMLFVAATVASLDAFADKKWGTWLLMLHIYPAMLFTLRLKYYEFFVLHGFCPWCLVSAVTITLCTVLVTLDWRRVRTLG